MKYRVISPDGRFFPHHFYRKSEAIAYQAKYGGILQRKVAYSWESYPNQGE